MPKSRDPSIRVPGGNAPVGEGKINAIDEELASVLAAKDEELMQLREQLERLHSKITRGDDTDK